MNKQELLDKTIQKQKEMEIEHSIKFYETSGLCLKTLYEKMNEASEKGKTGLMLQLDGEWHSSPRWSEYDDNRYNVYLNQFSKDDVTRLYGIFKYDLIQNGYCVSDWDYPYPSIDKNVIRFSISWGDEDIKSELSLYGKIYNFIVKLF